MSSHQNKSQGTQSSQPRSVAMFVKCPTYKSALESRFRADQWIVETVDDAWQWNQSTESIDCAVVDFGFVCFDLEHDEHAIDGSVERSLTELVHSIIGAKEPSSDNHGASIVTMSSRAWLGSRSDPAKAGAAASVVATSRSLSLLYARRGVAVNTVCALERVNSDDASTPRSLLPEGVSLDHVINTVLFFADPDNRYVTGQTLNVCGGASLLSSMSV